jgi:hypothetical protein
MFLTFRSNCVFALRADQFFHVFLKQMTSRRLFCHNSESTQGANNTSQFTTNDDDLLKQILNDIMLIIDD